LVKLGIIEDDSPDFITVEYRWEKTAPKKGKISINIEEAGSLKT
jgi:hypothetical protein